MFASFASVPGITEGAEGEEGTITEDDELLLHCAVVPCIGVPDKSTLPRKEEAEKAPSEGGLLPLSLLKDYMSIYVGDKFIDSDLNDEEHLQRQHQYWTLTMKIIGAQGG